MEIRIAQNNDNSPGVLAAPFTASPGSISWGAIVAGAAVAAALSLILLLLGTGLGLSSISPWASNGISGKMLGISTIGWITLTSLVASAFGGYIAGRLRNHWVDTQADEVYFRDTAHGFLAWAISTLATAILLSSATTAILSGGLQATASVTGGVAAATGTATGIVASSAHSEAGSPGNTGLDSNPTSYFLDSLFRPQANTLDAGTAPSTTPPASTPAAKVEVARIFVNALSTGSLAAEDVRYSAQVVSRHTELSQAEAEKRVNDTFIAIQTKLREAENTAKAAADKARKASAYTSLWLFISLLIGAFSASWMAVCGGRHRDLN
ncbi:MAG TPA: hypothetical protein VN030_02520 [Cellvibrio sp.]|nr:hypothetical protein [Cellvibrio sp.]